MMQFSSRSRVWVVGPGSDCRREPRRRGLPGALRALTSLARAFVRRLAWGAKRKRSEAPAPRTAWDTRDPRDQNWRLNCVAFPLLVLALPRVARGAPHEPPEALCALAPRALTLALGDGFSVSLAVFQLVFSAVVSITLWRLSAWQRRYEGLEGKLHETTTRLVDERFRAMTHEINGHVQGLLLALEEMKARIQNGDVELRGLGERDQRIELAVAAKIDLLKDYIRDYAAGKKDLEKNECAFERKLSTVEQKLVDLTSTVAVISERVRE